MGMPAAIELVGADSREPHDRIFALWDAIDVRFSTYKPESETSRINRGEINERDYSPEMQEIIALTEKTKRETNGYFDARPHDGSFDPSGVVKGWALREAAHRAEELGFDSFYVEIGGDIQTRGKDAAGRDWTIGIRNPFNYDEIVKVLCPRGAGIATSGNAARGAHIYNPHDSKVAPAELASITVLGPDIFEADRFATAAFAMGEKGIYFIESMDSFEAYAIAPSGVATMTSGLFRYLA